jgi:hypothetical protein
VANTEQFCAALQESHVPSELHLFEQGGDGFGMGEGECGQWTVQCAALLKARGLLDQEDLLPRWRYIREGEAPAVPRCARNARLGRNLALPANGVITTPQQRQCQS